MLGPDHPDTLTTRANLARWRGEAGDPAGPPPPVRELLADRLRVLGPDHPDTLTTRANLAHWRGEAGDAAGAATSTAELLADRLRVLGPDHPDTLTTRANLARLAGGGGDAAGAADRTAGCWPTGCGCWAPTTPTPSPPAAIWPIGRTGWIAVAELATGGFTLANPAPLSLPDPAARLRPAGDYRRATGRTRVLTT